MLTRRKAAVARKQEVDKLQITLLELKNSKELCTQLLSEREDSEKELLLVLDSRDKLKKELCTLECDYNDLNCERAKLQEMLDRFTDCSAEYEHALKAINTLERALHDANEQILELQEAQLESAAVHSQSLFEELVGPAPQLVTAPIDNPVIAVDYDTSTTTRSKWRRRKCIKPPPEDDNDCASLAWLLSFRLDEFVNVKVPDDEPLVLPEPPAVRKPPYTYPELIERALREKGELTVSAIYQWISDRFPYYKANDERWKNSVRHNLSINPHFRKGARAPQGAGHLWSLAANAIDLLPLRNQVILEGELNEAHIIECPKVIVLDEAAIAAASIIPDQDLFSGSTMFLNPVSTEQVVRECGLITVD